MLRQRKAKDKGNPQRKCTENEEQPSNCIICLDTVSCRGRLSVCKHWFCFHCIFEWSKNTNTCPVCKARFRCITKTHLDTLKSPPKTVRVQDKDQRVWNEDDDIVSDDYADLSVNPYLSDFDDDYEPPVHVTNPWTRTRQAFYRRPYPAEALDQYDLDDSFINDGAEQTHFQDNESDETSDDEECVVLPRESPYLLRRGDAVGNISLTDSILELVNEDCPSPATTGSFVVSGDDSDNEQWWMSPGERTQNSRRKNRSDHSMAHKEQMRRKTWTRNQARKMPKSQTTVRNQVSTRSRRVQKADDSSEEDLSDSNWINMNTRRENMRAMGSLPPSRRVSSRRCSRKTNQREARQVSSDSEQMDDDIPRYLVHNTDSSRPKRKGNTQPQVSSSNLQLGTLSTALPYKKQMSKQQTISSGESNESDNDPVMPTNNKLQLGKLSVAPHHKKKTRKQQIISSGESDESDNDPTMPTNSKLKGKGKGPNGHPTRKRLSDNLRSKPLSSRLKTKTQQLNKGDKMTKPSCQLGSLRSQVLIISSEGSDESDGDDLRYMPLSSRLKRKMQQPNKGNKVTKPSTETGLTRASSHQGNSCNSELEGKHDSGSDDDAMDCNTALNNSIKSLSKKAASKQTDKIALTSSLSVCIQGCNKAVTSPLSVRIKGCNMENQGCIARKERNKYKMNLTSTTTGISDEDCILPTPQPRRYHSIFTKRCHRSPTYNFDGSGDSGSEGCSHLELPRQTTKIEGVCAHSMRGQSSKLAEDASNKLCMTNARRSLHQDDSPIQARNCRKRRRLQKSDSEDD